VPLTAVLAFAAVVVVGSGQRAASADTVRSLTALSAHVSEATDQLQQERMAAASLVSGQRGPLDEFNARVKATGDAVGVYTQHRRSLHGLPTTIDGRLDRIDQQLETLDTIRQQVSQTAAVSDLSKRDISTAEVVARYTVVIDDLVAYHGDLTQLAGAKVANMLRAKAAFAEAKAQAAQEEAIGFSALTSGRLDQQEYSTFLATLTGQQAALSTFNLSATSTQLNLVNSAITGDAVNLSDRTAELMARSVGTRKPEITAASLSSSIGAVVNLMRWTERQLDAGLLVEADTQYSAVTREVIVELTLVIITLAVAILLAVMIARSMVQALNGLRTGALAVAEYDLPAAVARLRDTSRITDETPDQIADQIADPISIDSRDEVGQVASAFNVVHREAVRVAAEQAALRASVSAMFLNLARRSQALVDRIIGELDEIERGEEDPKRLSKLFQLDHLATRMRRNDENLLVLAGADSSAPRRDDALLVDVVRAAQSEVEQYNRIEFATVDQDVSVVALVVNDIVRLLAELLDNATRFSPPEATVVVDARRIGDYVLMQIEDRGLGMMPEQLVMLNQRLAQPQNVDVTSFRMMGLAVVGRLAERHEIKVELRPNPDGGTVAVVTLPTQMLVLPRLRGREQVLPQPRALLAVESAPSPIPPGWPMPSLPGLAACRNADETPTPAGTPATAINGLSHQPEANSVSPVALTTVHMTSVTPVTAPVTPVAAPVAPPVAPAAPVVGAMRYSTGQQRQVHEDDTAELPIFRAMEAVWFRSHSGADELSTSAFRTVPMPIHQPTGSASPYVPAPAASPPVPPSIEGGLPHRNDQEDLWRTAADDGWRAAAAAVQPAASGTTRSGLPKRVPAAQLVPGAVETRPANATSRRTPEEVRGLLSAYHRGVQRGRTGEDGRPLTDQRQADKEREQ
jgi:signal transduction histidine kinase